MIWIASFPRSGNTFLRNILFEVYGISSGSLPIEISNTHPNQSYEFTKTHLLPDEIPALSPEDKIIYIVRNGMDALVSLAHYRKDLLEPYTSFENNLLECIVAPGGSHFGGWSENIRQWKDKADIIIRFEDLIKNPAKEVEKITSIYHLPKGDWTKLPTFEDLKLGMPKYAPSATYFGGNNAFFRKGKTGKGKEEIPAYLFSLFEEVHGEVMVDLGYSPPTNLPKGEEVVENSSSSARLGEFIIKKILIDATKLRQAQKDGTQRYLEELLGAMRFIQGAKSNPSLEIDLFVGWGVVVPLIAVSDEGKPVKPSKLYKVFKYVLAWRSKLDDMILWKYISRVYYKLPFYKLFKKIHQHLADIPKKRILDKYDLIHIPLPQHVPFYKAFEKQLLVTVHDISHVLFPDYHTLENIELAEKGMLLAKKKNAKYIAISKSSQKDFQTQYDLNKEDLHLIYEAVNHNFFKAHAKKENIKKILKKYHLPNSSFFFCLSTLEPRKNLKNTILAFQKLYDLSNKDVILVIGGGVGWKEETIFEDINLEDYPIYFTGHIADEDLPILYAVAIGFCYVSFYEGFGLPILEAMSCGTAVITGNNSSMIEIIGNGGLLANPHDIYDIKKKMELLYIDKKNREELEKQALEQAYTFSWLKTALQTIDCYEKLI
ncbi:MAG: glycosyltransferase involved in cell wall biosynthesis [Maribacter sp.]|jgi:glycosyltransferase involved in cell wall biosynthesis